MKNMDSITQTQGRVKMAELQVMEHLWRGGAYACLWNDRRQSYWFKPSSLPNIPASWKGANIYVTIHPCSSIPPTNARGQKAPPHLVRSQLPYISAINCVFGEFDAKDEVWPHEYEMYLPDNLHLLSERELDTARKTAKEIVVGNNSAPYKARAMERIEAAPIAPTLLIDSGGGYHSYWFLADTIHIDDSNRSAMCALQARWVEFIGADIAAKDLTRVLRVPGTTNHKYDHKPIVTIEQYTPGLLYRLDDFESLLPTPAPKPIEPTPQTRAATTARTNCMESIIAEFNAQHPVQELLMAYGYPFCFRQGSTVRLARPGRTGKEPSVTVDTISNTSTHYSSTDRLYSEQQHDAFSIETCLKHNGDTKRAYEHIKKELGRWVQKQPRQFRDPQTGRIEYAT